MSSAPGAVPPAGEPVPPQHHSTMLGYEAVGSMAETNQEARTYGMLCHLLALSGFVIPFGHIIGPLIVWLIKKDQYAFVNDQGKESLNFQITVTIAVLVSVALIILLVGIVLTPIVALAALVLVIMASVNASSGKYYRYPVNIRLIK